MREPFTRLVSYSVPLPVNEFPVLLLLVGRRLVARGLHLGK